MRRPFSTDSQSLVLSILIHGIIAQVFVFSVPFQKIYERPIITFWGAFLSSIETHFPISDIPDKNILNVPIVSYSRPAEHIHPTKKHPLPYQTESLNKNKHLEKTTFLDRGQPDQMNINPRNQGYQKTKMQYQPLSLRPYHP